MSDIGADLQRAFDEGYEKGKADRPQGEWLFKKIMDDYHVTAQCSICKERRRMDNYCPNCGARMKRSGR